MKNRPNNALLPALSSGLLLAFGTSFSWAWPLLIAAFVPLLLLADKQGSTSKYLLHAIVANCIWIWGMNADMIVSDIAERTSAVVSGMLLLPLIWTLPFALLHLFQKRTTASVSAVLFPFFWVCLEVLQYYWSLSFTWLSLGNHLAHRPMFSLVFSSIGVEGVSFMIVYINVLISLAMTRIEELLWVRKLLIASCVVLMLVLLAGRLGGESEYDRQLQITFLQPTAEERERLDDDLTAQVDFLQSALDSVHFEGSDLLVCPEGFFEERTMSPLFTNSIWQHPAIIRLGQMSERYNTPIIAGASLVQLYRAFEPPTNSAKQQSKDTYYDVYNGSIFITPDKKVQWRSKQALVPVTEQIPMHRWINALESNGLFPWRIEKGYGMHASTSPYVYKHLRIAPLVCFEAQFPQIVQGYLNEGANLLIVMSSAWSSSNVTLRRQQAFARALTRSTLREAAFSSDAEWSSVIQEDAVSMLPQGRIVQAHLSTNATLTFYCRFMKPYYWFIVAIGISLLVGIRSRL